MIKPIENCPSCQAPLVWSDTNTDLYCTNISCEAQTSRNILHFFGTVECIDGFGPATIRILLDNGFDTIPKIYAMTYQDFQQCGYLHKSCMNLGTELEKSKERPIPDYRFLAALGLENFGRGSAKKFLEKYEIEDIFLVTRDALMEIDGFGSIVSDSIFTQMNDRHQDIRDIFDIGFNITKDVPIEVKESVFTDKRMTFSGKMTQNRKEMEEQAKSLGAIITGVNGKSDFLVCGEKVGKNKMDAAEKYGVSVISEEEYMEMLNGD